MINLNEIKIEDVLKKSDNLIIIAILIVGLIIALKINGTKSNAANILTQKINAQKKLDVFLTEINAMASNYQQYKKKIFFDKDSSQIVNMINDWTRSAGLEIISIRPLFLKEEGQFYQIPIELNVKGDYYNLGQFLSLIESYEGFIDIKSLKISPQRAGYIVEKEQSDKLNITLSLNGVTLKKLDISEAISGRR